jgi:hypothetical protein
MARSLWAGYRDGHRACPSSRPRASGPSARAGSEITSHWSPPLRASSRSRPARSSSFHRVMISRIAPFGSSRVYRVDWYQSQWASRTLCEEASSAFLIGSSMMARSAPLPVSGPPMPAVCIPPRCPRMFHRDADADSGSTAIGSGNRPPNSLISARPRRPHWAAKSAS